MNIKQELSKKLLRRIEHLDKLTKQYTKLNWHSAQIHNIKKLYYIELYIWFIGWWET